MEGRSRKKYQGFNVEALIFFRLLPFNCLNWKIYCNDHSSLSVILVSQKSKVRTYEALMASLSWFYWLAEANLHFIVSMKRNATENLNSRLNWNKVTSFNTFFFKSWLIFYRQILINSLHEHIPEYLAHIRLFYYINMQPRYIRLGFFQSHVNTIIYSIY